MCTEVLTYPENNMQDQLNNTCSCRYSVMNAVKEENFPNNKRPFKGHDSKYSSTYNIAK